jgi:uncharacterized protein (DUF1501 family)
MKRRNFLQMMAAAGLTAQAPLWAPKAQAAPPDRFLIVVNASGGWDPTSICDPKGLNQAYQDRSDRFEGSTNSVALDSNKMFGSIQWSAIPEGVSNDELVRQRINDQFDDFFTTHGDKLTVINGIDTGTNNHDTGNRFVWSGNDETGYPSLAAYFAASVAPTLPMAYISNGGYDFTDSLVARARASSAGFVSEVADPNSYYDDRGFHFRTANRGVDQYSHIEAAQRARIQRQLDSEQLPLRRKQLQQLFGIRNTDSNLGELTVRLDDLQANVLRDDHWNTNRANSLKSQAEVVVASMAAGLTASANLNFGGFDTHGNHDANAYPDLGDLLEGIHFMMVALQYAGIADRTTVVVGSDFGRTPYYNSGNGKDHWPVTSMLVLRPESSGGRVFGASTADFLSQPVNLTTGQPDAAGEILTPQHVNRAIRNLMGVGSSSLADNYPLNVPDFRIFG